MKCKQHLHFKIDIYKISKVGDPKATFSLAITPRCWEGATPFSGLFHFTLELDLIMLSVKQGGIEYHFMSL